VQSYRSPLATWLGSPNFTAQRQGHDLALAPSWVVIHTMVGSLQAANAVFQNPALQRSAHYGVSFQGDQLVQWVDEADAAWHAGVFGVNLDSIGIEHEDLGQPNALRPDGLYLASARLLRDVCQRYGIPIQHGSVGAGVSGIIPHRETGESTACPDSLDWQRIIQLAASPPLPTLREADMKFVTWHGGSHFFHVDDGGELVHHWNGPGWVSENVGAGHRQADGVEVFLEPAGGLLHVVARRSDGNPADYTQTASGAGSGVWVVATL
jgi:hypothetical protein